MKVEFPFVQRNYKERYGRLREYIQSCSFAFVIIAKNQTVKTKVAT